MTETGPQRAARRMADRARSTLIADIERLLADAGLSRAALARLAGVDDSHLARLLAGTADLTTATTARLATALGADLSVRLYPNTGPAIRDRHQAGILEALLASKHGRWHAYPEVAVRRPSRGWIDVALHDPRERTIVATEIESGLRRLEQLIRWSAEKAASLPSWDGWTHLGDEPAISRLLIIRDTRTNRAVARQFARSLRATYPAHPDDALQALTTAAAAWPGPAVLWSAGPGTTREPSRLIARP